MFSLVTAPKKIMLVVATEVVDSQALPPRSATAAANPATSPAHALMLMLREATTLDTEAEAEAVLAQRLGLYLWPLLQICIDLPLATAAVV